MVRELFVMAREHAPSIIFMDEIDSIGSSRLEGGSGGDSEVQRTMLELLNQLDGFEATKNIKVRWCPRKGVQGKVGEVSPRKGLVDATTPLSPLRLSWLLTGLTSWTRRCSALGASTGKLNSHPPMRRFVTGSAGSGSGCGGGGRPRGSGFSSLSSRPGWTF